MPLFTNQTLQEVMQDPSVKERYKNYRVINWNTAFLDLASGIGMSRNVGTRKNVKSVYQKEKERVDAIQREGGNLLHLLYQLSYKTCPDINEAYIQKALEKCVARDPYYEMIFITRPSKRITPNPTRSSRAIDYVDFNRENKLGKIVGFLIAQKGECEKYPNAYAVKLICTRESGFASLLIGTYLYAIRSKPHIMQKGLLELSGSFKNLNGYCLYRKMGFVVDPDIFIRENGKTCLTGGDGMLPMSVDLSKLSLSQILTMISSKSTNKEPLCDRRYENNPKYLTEVSESILKLNNLRVKIYNLEQLRYVFSRGFSQTRDYVWIFDRIFKNKIFLRLLIEIARDIKSDQELMKSFSVNTMLASLKLMIGWGTIYTLDEDEGEKYKTEFVFHRDPYNDADKDYTQLDTAIRSLHNMISKSKENFLFKIIQQKIDDRFREYTEEYDRWEEARPHASAKPVALEEKQEIEKQPEKTEKKEETAMLEKELLDIMKKNKTQKNYHDKIPRELHPWSPRNSPIKESSKRRSTKKSSKTKTGTNNNP